MSGEERDRAFEAFVAGRSAALLRTAYLVTGDEAAAQRLLRDALATTYLTWGRIEEREGVEEYVRRVMLTAHASVDAPPPGAPPGAPPRDRPGQIWVALRELTSRERAVLVLGIRDRLDDDEIARVLTSSRRTVRTDSTHAGQVVREWIAGHPVVPLEPEAEGAAAAPVARRVVVGVDAEIASTLNARADDVRPPPALVDDARDLAERLRAERRSRRLVGAGVAAGLLVVVGVVLGLVSVRDSGAAAPLTSSPAPSASKASGAASGRGSEPAPSVVALPDSVLQLARENGALIAFGSAIVDSGSGSTIVSVETDPTTGASRGGAILALARAAGGYVVLTRGDEGAAPKPLAVSYVRSDGTRVELGRVDTPTSGFAVAADGLSVVHVIKGPTEGENAIASGRSELVVQDLAADVENRITVDGDVLPVSLTGSTVVFRRLDAPVNNSYVWDRSSGSITRVAIPTNEIPVEVHDTRALLRTSPGASCVVVSDALTPASVVQVWRRCGVFGDGRFDPTGGVVAVVRAPEGKAELLVLDAKDGSRQYTSPLDPGVPFQLEWTGSGQKVLSASIDSKGQVSYTAVGRAGSGAGVVTRATYEVPEGPVVLGRELDLPAAG